MKIPWKTPLALMVVAAGVVSAALVGLNSSASAVKSTAGTELPHELAGGMLPALPAADAAAANADEATGAARPASRSFDSWVRPHAHSWGKIWWRTGSPPRNAGLGAWTHDRTGRPYCAQTWVRVRWTNGSVGDYGLPIVCGSGKKRYDKWGHNQASGIWAAACVVRPNGAVVACDRLR